MLGKAVSALTSADQPLFELFSTQGSAAVIATDDGFVAASRSKLKSDAALAAKFTLPKGTVVTGSKLQRAGGFVLGRVSLETPAAPAAAPVVAQDTMRDLWAAFMGDRHTYRDKLGPGGRRHSRAPEVDMAISAVQRQLVHMALATMV